MKKRTFLVVLILGLTLGLSGCSRMADPGRSIDKIKKEVETMSVKDLEAHALAYVAELKAQKAELDKIKIKMQSLPVDKIFSNDFMTKQVTLIGRKAESLFERYVIYLGKLKEKGADLSKVKLD